MARPTPERLPTSRIPLTPSITFRTHHFYATAALRYRSDRPRIHGAARNRTRYSKVFGDPFDGGIERLATNRFEIKPSRERAIPDLEEALLA